MPSTKRTLAVAAALSLLASAAEAQAPGPISVDLRAGWAMPTEDLGAHELENAGVGLEATVAYRVMPHLQVYGGWAYHHFELTEPVGDYLDVEDTGYALGVRFEGPTFAMATPWVRAGGVYNHLELESDEEQDVLVSSDHTLGWEAGVGASLRFGDRWSVNPGVRYRTFSPELDELGGEVDHAYVTFDLGFSAAFGGR